MSSKHNKTPNYLGINNRNDTDHYTMIVAMANLAGCSPKAALKGCIELGFRWFSEEKLKLKEAADATGSPAVPEVSGDTPSTVEGSVGV